MNAKYLIPFFILQVNTAYATDWNKLIEQAPTAKKERLQLDEKGYVVANVAKLSSGKMRFLGFSNFGTPTKPVVIVEAESQDLREICNLSVMAGKPFKAKLVMPTNAAASLQTGFFGDSSKLDQFENPVKISKAVISFAQKKISWSLYDKDVMKKAAGSIPEYYQELLNAKLQKSDGDVLEMDLSNLNALACDLMTGDLVIRADQTVEFEPGLPSQEMWVALAQYEKIYRNFWKVIPTLKSGGLSDAQNDQIDAMALGVAAAPEVRAEEILKSPARMQKFLASVKMKVGNLDAVQKASIGTREVMSLWSENTEYTKPKNELSSQTLCVSDAPVFVKFSK